MRENRPKDKLLEELLQNDPGFAEVYRCLPDAVQSTVLSQPGGRQKVDRLIDEYFDIR